MPVRLELDAIEVAKKAAALKGMLLSRYVSEAARESAQLDINAFVQAQIKAQSKETKGGGKS
jgi:hypothetical protein